MIISNVAHVAALPPGQLALQQATWSKGPEPSFCTVEYTGNVNLSLAAFSVLSW